MINKKKHHIDYPLAIAIAILFIFGILILSGISADFSQKSFKNSTYYFFHQIIYGIGIGLVLGFVAFKTRLSFFKKWSWVFLLINLFVMFLVFIPKMGIVSGGASRWINLGFFSFQPSEFLKLTFILYLSSFLSSKTDKKLLKKEKRTLKSTLFAFIFILIVIISLLYFQKDASTLMLIIIVSLFMYFFSKTPLGHNLLIFLIGAGVALVLIFSESYRLNRILVFLGLLEDPMKLGYQIKQALITIGSGGIFGLGMGMSNQKIAGFLPQTMSDSIFAIFAEELGFIGSFVLIFFFLFFAWRSFKIAKESENKFFQLFALGFGSWICIQAFVNIGAIIGIIPLTGIPLPFMSYGGSHIIAELIGVGILLNISQFIKK